MPVLVETMDESQIKNLTLIWISTSSKINNYFALFLFIFGLIGNLLNTLVLSQRSLRSNSCAWLFLVSSVFNLISILSGLTTRILSNWFLDITDQIHWLCKLRVFILLTSRTIASWLLMLAIFDRWLLSCLDVHYRRMSTLKNAQRGTLIIIFLSKLIYMPIFFCYQANLRHTPLKCYSRTISCRIYADQTYIHLTILWPLMMMILFGFLTMSNVRHIHNRARTSLLPGLHHSRRQDEHRQRLKAIDRHLLIMLLVQISFLSLFTLPQAIEMIYLTITSSQSKSLFQRTVENSIFSFVLLLTYLASGIPFYIYTLSGGRVFRDAFHNLLERLAKKLSWREK